MKQVLVQKGNVIVGNVPAPKVEHGEILVRVRSSCLSVGTEMSGVKSTGTPLWKRALAQPEKITTVVDMVKEKGIKQTWKAVEDRKESSYPAGYSAAGEVISIGDGVSGFAIGDRVACAGAQCAYHAEYIRVPQNLAVPIGNEVDWNSASTVTLGAIALQGVRRAKPTLGETFVVIGLGILGQLTVQFLRANGCKTIGIDLDQSRIDLAISQGMDIGLHPDVEDYIDQVARLTAGIGADGVLITAATTASKITSTAFRMCRKKGRVILVGDVGLDLNRADFYVKEIDFLISTSYGPGRYDNRYEHQGLDYPISYVRWTENRNMQAYIDMLGRKQVDVTNLISMCFNIDDAPEAYNKLKSPDSKPMMVLLNYPDSDSNPSSTLYRESTSSKHSGKIRIAVLGAGGFAYSVHLPNLWEMDDMFSIHAVATRTGHSAAQIAKEFGAKYATTDEKVILSDPDIDAVLIATRHNQHADLVLSALKSGKHVFVEKPLVLTQSQLDELDEFIVKSGAQCPVLLTGYNRRFSPYAQSMSNLINQYSTPFIMNYRMNAGYIPLDHWVHGIEGGGRNLGEACHFYDLFTFLANDKVIDISAHAINPVPGVYASNDNFVATMSFKNGSIASLTYTSLGTKTYAKETADLYVNGKIALLDDYRGMAVHGAKKYNVNTKQQNKGLKDEMLSFALAIQNGEWPIPWWQQKQASEISLKVENILTPVR
jgi:predicted dehydrogenase/threonine dehydrogenase-like Zn-dependent dehydrogenase